MTLHTPQAIIFDVFGVLLRPNPIVPLMTLPIRTILKYCIQHRKSPIGPALDLIEKMPEYMPEQACYTLKYKNRFLPAIFDQWQKGTISRDDLVEHLSQYLDQLGKNNYFSKHNDRSMMRELLHYFSSPPTHPYSLLQYRRMVNMVKKLKKSGRYKLFIISNVDTETYAHMKKYHGAMINLFDGVIASCDVGHVKPEHTIYQELHTKYQVDLSRSLFIDDQEENCRAAQQMGMQTIICSSVRNAAKQLKQLL